MSFDVAAESYESFMGRYSRPLAREFVAWSGLPEHGPILDVGCGPGALLTELARSRAADDLAGVDPSDSFVRAAREQLPGVDIHRAPAEKLPFPDGAFAATLAELVVHFMSDADAGAREMMRVTRPGGTVAVCVWDFGGGRAPQTRFFEALSTVALDVADETERFGGHDGDLGGLLRDAGCVEVEEDELSVTVPYASFEEWWEPYTLGVAPAGAQLAALDDSERELVRAEAIARMPDGRFTVTATAWAARGIRP